MGLGHGHCVGLAIASWAGVVTSKLAAIETRMATWDRQAALIDEVRSEQLRGGYTLSSMGDAQSRLTKLEITLHRLEEDVKDLLRRKPQP